MSASGSARPASRLALGLRTKLLIVFLCVGCLPAIGVGWLAFASTRANLIDEAAANLAVQAAAIGNKIDRNLFERYGDVQAFAFNPMARGDAGEVTAAANFYTRAYGIYDLMIVADADGTVIAANTVDFEGKPLDTRRLLGRSVKGEAWFEEIVAGRVSAGQTHVADLGHDAWLEEITGEPHATLSFSAPVLDDAGRVVRVWSNRASWRRTGEQIAREQHDAVEAGGLEIEANVVSKSGLLLTSQGKPTGAEPIDYARAGVVAFAKAAAGETGFTLEEAPGRSGRQLIAYAPEAGALGFPGYGWSVLVEANEADVLATVIELRNRVAATVALAALAVGMVALWFSGSIAAPVADVERALAQVADGNLAISVEARGTDEIGRLGAALNTAAGNVAETVREIRMAVATLAASSEELTAVSKELGANADGTLSRATSASSAASHVSDGIDSIAGGSEEMSASIAEIQKTSEDSARVVAEAVKSAQLASESVTRLDASGVEISQVSDTIKTIAERTNELAATARSQADRAEGASKGFAAVANEVKDLARQTSEATDRIGRRIATIQADTADAVSSIAAIGGAIAKIDELTSRIDHTLRSGSGESGESAALEVGRIAREAVASAKQAVQTVADIDARVQQLGRSSDEVGEVVRVIETIARQTKLLSLNATIEAQRAGDAALGFGAVADQVKGLARQTTDATGDIRSRIEMVQGEAKGAVAAMSGVAAQVERVRALSGVIAASVSQQRAASEEISSKVLEASKGSQEIATAVTQVAELARNTSSAAASTQTASGDLAALAAKLETSVSEFRV